MSIIAQKNPHIVVNVVDTVQERAYYNILNEKRTEEKEERSSPKVTKVK